MRNLIIIGAGGFGREIVWVTEDINNAKPTFNIIGFVDDDKEIQDKEIDGVKVVGSLDDLPDLIKEYDALVTIGILDTAVRRKLINRFRDVAEMATIIHPNVVISHTAIIGMGTVVFPYATVGVDAVVGENCFLNLHTAVGHDCRLGENVSLLIGAILCGAVEVGKDSTIATNATVLPGKKIGSNVMVGAGSVVKKKTRDNVTLFGNPAQVIGNRKPLNGDDAENMYQ